MRSPLARVAHIVASMAVLCVAVPARAEDGPAVRAELEITMDPAAMASVVADVAHLADSYGFAVRVVRPPVAADGRLRWSLPPIKIVRIAADDGRLIAAIDAVAAFGDATGLAVRKTPFSVGGMTPRASFEM